MVVFPRAATSTRRLHVQRWSARLLSMMGVRVHVHGMPAAGLPATLLIVANHVSWVDIFVINALVPSHFVAKADLARWPLVGRLIANVGTLFIERDDRRHAHRINDRARAMLAAGEAIAIFPEGTTTDGSALLPFKGSLLQPIIDAGGHLQPVALSYRRGDGTPSVAAAYVGDTSFLQSFWRVVSERALVVDVTIAAAIAPEGRHRRELARRGELVIRAALARAESGSAPGTAGDPRDGAR